MSVDLTKIKPGDEVTVRGVVGLTFLCSARDPALEVLFAGSSVDVPADRIVDHIPAPPPLPTAGDRVRLISVVKDQRGLGTIKHVIEGRAWVDWANGDQLIHQLDHLKVADE